MINISYVMRIGQPHGTARSRTKSPSHWAIPFNICDPLMEEQNFLGEGGGELISKGGGGGGGWRYHPNFLGVVVSEIINSGGWG